MTMIAQPSTTPLPLPSGWTRPPTDLAGAAFFHTRILGLARRQERTIERAEIAASLFAGFLTDDGQPATVESFTLPNVRACLKWLRPRFAELSVTPTDVADALRCWARVLVGYGILDEDPFADNPRPTRGLWRGHVARNGQRVGQLIESAPAVAAPETYADAIADVARAARVRAFGAWGYVVELPDAPLRRVTWFEGQGVCQCIAYDWTGDCAHVRAVAAYAALRTREAA